MDGNELGEASIKIPFAFKNSRHDVEIEEFVGRLL